MFEDERKGTHNPKLEKVWVYAGPKLFEPEDIGVTQEDGKNISEENTEAMISDSSYIFESHQIFIHDEFKWETSGSGESLFNDITLIELNRVLHFSDVIRPICLYNGDTQDLMNSETAKIVIVGYGGTKNFNQADFIHLDTDDSDCIDSLQNNTTHSERGSVICGKARAENTITCKGDSGSPLMVRTTDIIGGEILTKWSLLGAVSMGPQNCDDTSEKRITVFSKLYSGTLRDWIENKINNATTSLRASYCYQDDISQCASCRLGYNLVNSECQPEFTLNQLNSMYAFFQENFCAENCPSYMKLVTPGDDTIRNAIKNSISTRAIGNGDSDDDEYEKYISVIQNLMSTGGIKSGYNECYCKFGEPTLRCTTEKPLQSCDPEKCFEFYHYNDRIRGCQRNICSCNTKTTGTRGPASKCRIHQTEQCDCKRFYHLDSLNNCVENVCECDDPDSGPIENKKCTEHGKQHCVKCKNIFYHYDKKEKSCKRNICQCPYGEPKQNCPEHGKFSCKLNSCRNDLIQYLPVDVMHGIDCIQPCEYNLVLDSNWFSPSENATYKQWLLVELAPGEGLNFQEAVDHCGSKGTYVGLPSSMTHLSEILSKTGSGTWIGLSKRPKADKALESIDFSKEENYDLVWERFGEIHNNTQYNITEILDLDSSNRCLFLNKSSSNDIELKMVDCDQTKVNKFVCEYFVTEKEEKSKGSYSRNELLFYEGGYNFAYYRMPKNWDDANKFCEDKGNGWSLAEVRSIDTLDIIVELIGRDSNFWIGAKRPPQTSSGKCTKSNGVLTAADFPFEWESNSNKIFSNETNINQNSGAISQFYMFDFGSVQKLKLKFKI